MEPKGRNILTLPLDGRHRRHYHHCRPPVPPPLTPLVLPPHAQRQGTESGGGGLDVALEDGDVEDDAQHVYDAVSVALHVEIAGQVEAPVPVQLLRTADDGKGLVGDGGFLRRGVGRLGGVVVQLERKDARERALQDRDSGHPCLVPYGTSNLQYTDLTSGICNMQI